MRLELFLTIGLTACLADTAPGKVGSETHFLSACVGHDDCPSALSCFCGICTTACTDTCALGACASPDSAALLSYCDTPQTIGLCLATCEDGCDECVDGICLAGPRADGSRCDTPTQCEQGECTLGFCGPACALPTAECPENHSCLVPGAVAGVCVPWFIHAVPNTLQGGTLALGTQKTLQITLSNQSTTTEVIQLAIETRDTTPATEVSVEPAFPVTLEPGAFFTFEVFIAPNREGPRPYRLVLAPRNRAQSIDIPIDFTGAP